MSDDPLTPDEADKIARRYPSLVSETQEGIERARQYHSALGRFVDRFAEAENTAHFVLRHYAKLPVAVGRALLSGVRVDQTRNNLKRLVEAGVMSQADSADLEPTLQQLNIINDRRNGILHHGATSVSEGKAVVTNALMALSENRITVFAISPEILDDMTSDLRKIMLHMLVRHAGRPEPKAPKNRDWIASTLREPWRYKLPSSPLKTKGRSKKKAQADQPKPSEG